MIYCTNYIDLSLDFLSNNQFSFVGCSVVRFENEENVDLKPVDGYFHPESKER